MTFGDNNTPVLLVCFVSFMWVICYSRELLLLIVNLFGCMCTDNHKKTRAVFLENILCLFYLFVSCLLVFLSGLAKGAPFQ